MRHLKWLFGLILFAALVLQWQEADAVMKALWVGGGDDANDGRDWNNAYASMQEFFDNASRLDTLLTAGGWEITTAQTTFQVGEDGDKDVFVLAALPHLGSQMVGWDDSLDYKYEMISSETAINAVLLTAADYLVIDGIIGATPDSSTTQEYDNKRIAFAWADSTQSNKPVIHLFTASNITFNAVEVRTGGMSVTASQNCFVTAPSGTNNVITLQYCYIHDASAVHLHFNDVRNSLIDHNYFKGRAGAAHGESISWNPGTPGDVTSNSIISYNFFEDIQGTGNIAFINGTNRGFLIYGNVFFTHNPTTFYNTNAPITNGGADDSYDMEVYNNTFYNQTPNTGGVQWTGIGTGNITYNNLFHTNGEVQLWGTLDNNASEFVGIGDDDCEYDLDDTATNVFTSVTDGSENFKPLAGYAGQDVASDMSAIFTLDITGATFGADGGWDVGAIEGAAGSPPVVGPPWFVKPTGDDAKGGGDSENAFVTVAQALSVWGQGEIIYLQGDGTYRETVTVNVSGIDGDNNIITRYGEGADPIINGSDVMTGSPGWVAPGGTTTTVNDVADDDCYRNSTYYEEYGTNTLLVAGDAFGDSSSFIIKVTIPADYSSGDSTTVRFPDAQRVGGATLPKLNFYIENKAATSITNAATYNLALGDSGSVHILVEYGLVNQTDTVFIDIQPLIDEAIADGIAAGEDVNICCKVIDIETNQYNQFDALEAGDKPAYVKWDYTATGGAANVYTLEGVSTETKIVFFDGTLGTKVANAPAVNSQDEWFWTTAGDDTLYIYSTTDADTLNIEAGQRNDIISISSKNYIILDNLRLKIANDDGVYIVGASAFITVRKCTIEYIFDDGIVSAGDNGTFDTNITRFCQGMGIKIIDSNDNNILNSTSNGNTEYGIQLSVTSLNNTISGCLIYDNGSHGGYMLTDCDGNVWKYILFDGNLGDNLRFDGTCDGDSAYFNISVDPGSDHIEVRNNCEDAYFSDNAFYGAGAKTLNVSTNDIDALIWQNNAVQSSTTQHVYITDGSSITATTNGYFPVHANSFTDDGGSTFYDNLADWITATGEDVNSLAVYAAFTDTVTAGGYDFTLLTSSAYIGKATLVPNLIRDYAGLTVPMPAGQNPDIGAHEEQTVYLPTRKDPHFDGSGRFNGTDKWNGQGKFNGSSPF